jgi:hypothetical protein
MYDDNEKPLLNSGDFINVSRMNTILSEIDQQLATAYHCSAIPGIGVGHLIDLIVGNNTVATSSPSGKFSGTCIISKIQHRIEDNHYTQTIDLIKGN